MYVQTIGVVGCGLMGSGIAEVAAKCGFDVIVGELNDDLLHVGMERIEHSLGRAVIKSKLSQIDADRVLANINGTVDLADLAAADLIIEAVTEQIELKERIFSTLDAVVGEDVILATNTSSISIAAIAAVSNRPDRVLGMHFFNPVPVMPLLELVRGLLTSDETMSTAISVSDRMGKTTVVAKDSPGFIINRLLIPFIIDAIAVFDAGLASREDIDTGIKLGLAHPMGPLTLADFVGLDTTLAVSEVLYNEYGDPRFKAPPLLRQMVIAGLLGRKSGRGFYDYSQ